MQTKPVRVWLAKSVTLLVAALAVASGVYWVLKISEIGWVSPAFTETAPSQALEVGSQTLAQALGEGGGLADAPLAPAMTSRFVLLGVLAGRSTAGTALIAMDGKPAKPYRVGAELEAGLLLQAVQGRRAMLASDLTATPALTLELPPLRPTLLGATPDAKSEDKP